MEILGYIGAICIGLVLGLTGGGGSILTVPILVYILSINPIIATAYSLFVVGVSSSFGALRNIQKKQVSFKTSLAFAVSAVIMVFCTRKYIIPAVPNVIFSTENSTLSKEMSIMILFAVLMLVASFSMIRDRKNAQNQNPKTTNFLSLFLLGGFTGLVTGTVGAGGGFIIVPILVLLAKLPMKKAVGTSLFIVSINALIGFLGSVSSTPIDWFFLLTFTLTAVVGIFIGIYLSQFIDGKKLKKAFGWFVLVMGIYIFYREVF